MLKIKSLFINHVVLFIILMCMSLSVLAETKIYLEIDGIPGESTYDAYSDGWIDAISFEFNVEQSDTANQGGGHGESSVNFGPVIITKLFDKATPKLFLAVAKGQIIPEVKIVFVRHDLVVPVEFFVVTLTNA